MGTHPRGVMFVFRFIAASLIAAFLAAGLNFPPFVTNTQANGSFVVNSSLDTYSLDSVLTLREAIAVANGVLTGPFSAAEQTQLGGCTFAAGNITGGCGAGIFDNITFDPAITQVVLAATLPSISDPGTWINGAAGVPRIDATGSTSYTFTIDADHVTISNLSLINSPSGYGEIYVQSGKNIALAYNYLGVLPNSTSCVNPAISRNGHYGVIVGPGGTGSAGANNNTVYLYGNTIGCHVSLGVYVLGADYVTLGLQRDGTTIDGNYIGTNSSGDNLGEGSDGVRFFILGADAPRFGQVYGGSVSYNAENGIYIYGTGVNNSTSSYSSVIRGVTISHNSMNGIFLQNGAYLTWIGGLVPAHVNIIADNGLNGINLLDTNGCVIQGNLVSGSGSAAVQAGINLENSDSTTIMVNNIQGSTGSGVRLFDSSYNTLTFNSIGTNFNLTSAAPNAEDGINIVNGSTGNTIGGPNPADKNFISGNTLCGVHLSSNADNNDIAGNYIGLDGTGSFAIPNGGGGVCIQSGSDFNEIGLVGNVEYQYISGNGGPGVKIENSDGNLLWPRNRIGVASDGVTALGNSGDGVQLSGVLSTTIGANTIAYNGGAGVSLMGAASVANILPEFVGFNGGIPIDLKNDGFTPNDTGDGDSGPNDLLNYPIIDSVDPNTLLVQGTACPFCIVWLYETNRNPGFPGGSARRLNFAIASVSGTWAVGLVSAHTLYTLSAVTYSNELTSELTPSAIIALPLILKP